MIRFNAVLIASVLLLGLATGCQNEEEVIETPPVAVRRKTPSPATPQATPSAAPASPGQAKAPATTASPGQAKAPATTASPGQAKAPAATASPGQAKTPAAPANTVAQAPKAATPAQSPAVNKAKIKQSMGGLKGYLPAAVRALQANDVATAKQYAQAFNANWNQKIIQFAVKNQSQATYNKIATGVTNVNNTMKPATPDKTKAIPALQSLAQSVDEYAKSP